MLTEDYTYEDSLTQRWRDAVAMLDFRASHHRRMHLLAEHLHGMSEDTFFQEYNVSKFEVSNHLGQLQALVKLRTTTQTGAAIAELTVWFRSLFLKPLSDKVN